MPWRGTLWEQHWMWWCLELSSVSKMSSRTPAAKRSTPAAHGRSQWHQTTPQPRIGHLLQCAPWLSLPPSNGWGLRTIYRFKKHMIYCVLKYSDTRQRSEAIPRFLHAGDGQLLRAFSDNRHQLQHRCPRSTTTATDPFPCWAPHAWSVDSTLFPLMEKTSAAFPHASIFL